MNKLKATEINKETVQTLKWTFGGERNERKFVIKDKYKSTSNTKELSRPSASSASHTSAKNKVSNRDVENKPRKEHQSSSSSKTHHDSSVKRQTDLFGLSPKHLTTYKLNSTDLSKKSTKSNKIRISLPSEHFKKDKKDDSKSPLKSIPITSGRKVKSHHSKSERNENKTRSSKDESSSHKRSRDEKKSPKKHHEKHHSSSKSSSKSPKTSNSPKSTSGSLPVKRKSNEADESSIKPKRSKYLTNRDLSNEIQSLRSENKEFMEGLFKKYIKKTKKAFHEICQESIATHCAPKVAAVPVISADIHKVINMLSKGSDPKGLFSPSMDSNYDHVEEELKKIVGDDEGMDDSVISIGSDEDYGQGKELKTVPKPVTIKRESDCEMEVITNPVEIPAATPENPEPAGASNKTTSKVMEVKIKTEFPIKKESVEIPGMDISSEFQALSKNIIHINYWFRYFTDIKFKIYKDDNVLKSMLTENSLYSLFKCMGAKCNYTTTSITNFSTHLNEHTKSNYFQSDFFLYCPYCTYKADNPMNLIDHYKNSHYNCIYQCNLCFYRSAEAQSVYEHQHTYHKLQFRNFKIFECPKVFDRNPNDEEQRANRRICLLEEDFMFNCKICAKSFRMFEDFEKHLSQDHKKEADVAAKMLNELRRRRDDDKFGKYQCIECPKDKPFGTNLREKIRTHLQHHPNRQLFACMRQDDKFIAKKIPSRKDLDPRPYLEDTKCLENPDAISITYVEA